MGNAVVDLTDEVEIGTALNPAAPNGPIDDDGRRRRPSVPPALIPIVEAAVVGFAAMAVAVGTFGMWRRRGLTTPLFGTSDELFYNMLAANMQRHGWYMTTPELGAPHSLDLVDFPQGGDNLTLVFLKIISLFPVGPVTATNLMLVATFGTVGFVTHLVLRSVGMRRDTAAVVSVLFACLPYHFARSTGHLFLNNYVAVPLLLLLLHWLVRDGLLPAGRPPRRLVGIVLAVVVASCGSYYAVFSALLLASAGVLETLRCRRWRPLVATSVVAVAMLGVLAANNVPTLINDARHGPNLEAAAREAAESETYGLRLSALVTPGDTHRIAILEDLGDKVQQVAEPSENGNYLGLFGVAGLLLLVGFALARAAGASPKLPQLLGPMSAMGIVAILVATKGGGSLLFATLIDPQVRGWNRMSVVLGLFGLVALGLCFDQFRLRRLAGRWGRAVLALALVFGLADQIPRVNRFDADEVAASFAIDQDFVHQLEQEFPEGATVYYLPFMRFPETPPIAGINAYDPIRLMLAGTGQLHWSYGGMRGRAGDWQESLIGLPPAEVAQIAAAAGFDAVVIDRLGFVNAAEVVDQVAAVAGGPLVASAGDRYIAFDVRRLRDELATQVDDIDVVGRAITSPPIVSWISGAERAGETYPLERLVGPRSVIEVRNDTDSDVPVRLVGLVVAAADASVVVAVDGERILVPASGEMSVPFTVQPGTTQVEILVDGASVAAPGDDRDFRARIVGGAVIDRRAEPLLEVLRADAE